MAHGRFELLALETDSFAATLPGQFDFNVLISIKPFAVKSGLMGSRYPEEN
jgi:hypothetical protein